MTIVQYKNRLKKKLEGLLAALISQAFSSALSGNKRCCLREGLKKQPKFTAFNSYVSDPNIFNPTLAAVKSPKAGFAIWQRYCWHLGIKNLISTAYNIRSNGIYGFDK